MFKPFRTKAKTLYIVTAFIGQKGYKNGASRLTNETNLGPTSEIEIASAPSDSIEGHVFKNIENVTIGRGLPGKNTDMSAPVNDDTYSISQLYQFVKGLERKDGGIKYSQIEKQTYGFEYDSRNDGELYSDRDPDAPTNRELLINALETDNMSPSQKGMLTKYKNSLSKSEKITNKIKDTADRINGLERPKPNEGYALKNGISSKSIPQNS